MKSRLVRSAAILVASISFAGLGASAAEASSLPKWRSGAYVCHKHTKPVHGKRIHCVKRPKHRSGSSAWVLPRYVVMCESGGNPRAVNRTAAGIANGTPGGLYQITRPTWRGYGGTRYAPTAEQASVYAQGVIAKRVLAAQGTRAWACW